MKAKSSAPMDGSWGSTLASPTTSAMTRRANSASGAELMVGG